MTPVQLQTAYRLAVQSSLVAFYEKSEGEAKRLVDSWWQRASHSSDIQSGMYLHSEAFATATDLAHAEEVPFTDIVRRRYHHIILDSTRIALSRDRQPAKSSKRAEVVRQMAG
jgi:hypothetical protein